MLKTKIHTFVPFLYGSLTLSEHYFNFSDIYLSYCRQVPEGTVLIKYLVAQGKIDFDMKQCES